MNDIKIFFGNRPPMYRTDTFKYQIAKKLIDVQEQATWFPNKLSFSKDKVTVQEMHPELLRVYRDNLIFQTMADSRISDFLEELLIPMCTSSEWIQVLRLQSYFEMVHTRSYSWNIIQVFEETIEYFDAGCTNPKIISQFDYENLIIDDSGNRILKRDKPHMHILKLLIVQYAIEAVRFYLSFTYTLKINDLTKNGLQGSENNILLINNDEKIHVSIFKNIINILRNNKDEGFSDHFEGFDAFAESHFTRIINIELKRFNDLNDIHPIAGMTEKTVRDFLEYYSHRALKGIGVNATTFNTKKTILARFFADRTKISNQKSLAQETDKISYNIDALTDKNDLLNFEGKL